MIPGGDIGAATAVDNAVDQFASSVDQLVKALADGSLSTFDQARFIEVMKSIEQVRNRIPLMDHVLIGEAQARDLPDAFTQPSMIWVLISVLRLSPGEASPAGPGRRRGR